MPRRYRLPIGCVQILHGVRLTYQGRVGEGVSLHQFVDETGATTEISDAEFAEYRRFRKLRDETADETRRLGLSGRASLKLRKRHFEASPADVAEGRFRHHFVSAYMMAKSPPQNDVNLDRIAEKAWPSAPPTLLMKEAPRPRTLRKWIRAFDQFGFEGLLSQNHLSGNFEERLSLPTILLMQSVVDESYCSERCLTVDAVHGVLKEAFKKENRNRKAQGISDLPCPGMGALRRHIRGLCPITVAFTRHGEAAARRRFKVLTGQVATTRHNERWEVDHTRMNVMVRISPDSNVRARPWITVVLDCHTRAVVGFRIGFQAPSVEVTSRALRMAILPKDWLMETYGEGLRNHYPCEGMAKLVCTDQGSDFKAADLRDRVALLKADTMFTPVFRPYYRARIERFFRTLDSQLLNTLPGTVNSDIFKRDVEMLKVNPGSLTLDNLWRIVLRWIVDVYHVRHHKGLKAAPMSAYEQSVEDTEEAPPPSEEEVDVALSWCKPRVINEYGIRVRGIYYRDEQTAAVFARHGKPVRVQVYRSPIEMAEVHFKDPDNGEWTAVQVAAADRDKLEGITEDELFTLRRLELVSSEADEEEDAEAQGDAMPALRADIASAAQSQGHTGRTVEDAVKAKAKMSREVKARFANAAALAGLGKTGGTDADVSDFFGLAAAGSNRAPLNPTLAGPVQPPAAKAKRSSSAKAGRAVAAADAVMNPTPTEPVDDDDLSGYRQRNGL